MKVTLRVAFVSLLATSGGVHAQVEPPNDPVEVKVVNEPLNVIVEDTLNPLELIGPMFTPSDLRSIHTQIFAPAGRKRKQTMSFDEDVVLREISFLPTSAAGSCIVRIAINDVVVTVLGLVVVTPVHLQIRVPSPIDTIPVPSPIVAIPVPAPVAGQQWQPPGSIDFTPNDTLSIQMRSLAEKGALGECRAEVVVMATISVPSP